MKTYCIMLSQKNTMWSCSQRSTSFDFKTQENQTLMCKSSRVTVLLDSSESKENAQRSEWKIGRCMKMFVEEIKKLCGCWRDSDMQNESNRAFQVEVRLTRGVDRPRIIMDCSIVKLTEVRKRKQKDKSGQFIRGLYYRPRNLHFSLLPQSWRVTGSTRIHFPHGEHHPSVM